MKPFPNMNEANEATDGQEPSINIENIGASTGNVHAPMMMNLNSALGTIDEDDISLPLSLIKGLRRKHHHSMESSSNNGNAMDSSTSSNNTSDKDDSGGDEEGGSNTSSTSKPSNGMTGTLSIGTFGQISSLSGSEQEGNNGGRVGILRVGGGNNNTSFSSSSEGENIAGDDELSERVVVHGKSVTSSQQQQQQQQGQYKVSFAEGHCSKRSGSDDGDEAEPSPKRKRNQEKNKSSPTFRPDDENNGTKRQRIDPREFKNNSISFSDSNSGNERRNGQPHEQQQQRRDGSVRAVSSSSSATGSGGSSGQDAGQASSSSPLNLQGDDAKNKNEPSMSSPHLTSKPDSANLFVPKCPTSPSKQMQGIHHDNLEERRLERNQREKERSNKIASQVDALRCLLQRGGLFIPKNTKSTVLSEASNYIQTLQDRQQMMSLEMENLKCQLVAAVTARGQQQQLQQAKNQQQGGQDSAAQDYHLIFKNTIAGMCVASMGGALLDCNAAFESETGLSQPKVGEMTIFNIIHANDLSRALDLISRMIDSGYVGQGATNVNQAVPPGQDQQEPLIIRSAFQHRPDLGLCIMLVRGTDTVAKCFSITLVKNASSVTGARGGNPAAIPFNPTLPAIPSMPLDSLPTVNPSEAQPQQLLPKPAISQPARVPQQPIATTIQVNPAAAAFNNGMLANNAALSQAVNLVPGPTVGALSVPQAAVPQASTVVPQPAAVPQASLTAQQPATVLSPSLATPQGAVAAAVNATSTGTPALNSQQLMQLILLSQQQQQLQQGHQQQQASSPAAPNLQLPSAFPVAQQQQIQQPQFQQYQQQLIQLNQIPAQLQANAPPAAAASVPPYWNPQNLAMFPQFQQMLKPPGSNASSSQASNSDENNDENDGPAYYASG